MNKLVLIMLLLTGPIKGSNISDFIVTLPNQNEVLSLLSTYIVSWSPLTLKDISQEIARKKHSQASLEKYLTKRMFGDTDTKCLEISFAAKAIISESSQAHNLAH